MRSFREFREKDEERKAKEVVLKGMNLQRGSDFWDDLLSLCGNAEGMSELLDVPKEKITALSGRINKIKSDLDGDEEVNTKKRLVKTGDKA
jgi:hypothetical protein